MPDSHGPGPLDRDAPSLGTASGPHRVVAVLGRGQVPADTPILRADDLGALRGDGIFEATHVRGGRPWLIDEHLARMARSAARMDLDLPPAGALAELAEQAVDGWPVDVEGALRIVCTRGVEDGGPATVFATLNVVGARSRNQRRDGIAVATASLGYPSGARADAPWLLGGAKTVSYAVNMASQRWAAAQGLDDVLWVSGDGWVLEAPTANVVWLADGRLWTVPAKVSGILAGITTRWLLSHAGDLGFGAGERMIRPTDLTAMDGLWLASSVRGLAEIRTLDDKPLGPSPETGRIQALLGFPV
jgi:4-amino-4-deoxychorismate lyase